MMYEPNERKQHMDIQELEMDIYHNVIHGNDFLQIAKADNKIVGYLRQRGESFIEIFILQYCCGCIERVSGERDRHDFF